MERRRMEKGGVGGGKKMEKLVENGEGSKGREEIGEGRS